MALLRAPKLPAVALIRLLPTLIDEQNKNNAYRIYVTDALRLIGENTAKYASGEYISERYARIIAPKKRETRTGEEIVSHMKNIMSRLAVSE